MKCFQSFVFKNRHEISKSTKFNTIPSRDRGRDGWDKRDNGYGFNMFNNPSSNDSESVILYLEMSNHPLGIKAYNFLITYSFLVTVWEK